jgi:hypothetical protein
MTLRNSEDPESPFPEAVLPYGQGFRDPQPTAAHEPDGELDIGAQPGGKRFDLRAGREDKIAPVMGSVTANQSDSVQTMTREPGGPDGLVQRAGDDQPRYLPPLTGQFRKGLVERLRGTFPVLCNLPECAAPECRKHVVIEHGLVGTPCLRRHGKAAESAPGGVAEGLAASRGSTNVPSRWSCSSLILKSLASRLVRNAASRRFPPPSYHCTVHGLFLLRGRLVRDATS